VSDNGRYEAENQSATITSQRTVPLMIPCTRFFLRHMSGARYSSVGARFSLILGTRFEIRVPRTP